MPLKKKRPSTPSSSGSSVAADVNLAETQFVPRDDDNETMWEAEAILDEDVKGRKFLVQWAGIDPQNGESWMPSWEDKNDVTPALIAEWKEKKKLDPMLIGSYKREQDAKKEAARAAKATRSLTGKTTQVRKRKRAGDSSISIESPKKPRRDTNKPVSNTSKAASVTVKGTNKPLARSTRSTASPKKQKELAAGPTAHKRKPAPADDTSFEAQETGESDGDQDDSFHPPSSPHRRAPSRQPAQKAKSRSAETGAPLRATRQRSATASNGNGDKGSAVPIQSADALRDGTSENVSKAKDSGPGIAQTSSAHNGSKRSPADVARAASKGSFVATGGPKTSTETRTDPTVAAATVRTNNQDKPSVQAVAAKTDQPATGRNDVAPIGTASSRKPSSVSDEPPSTVQDHSARKTTPPTVEIPSARPHTPLEGLVSPNIVMNRRHRLGPVPQPAPALFRQNLPETQTTDTDKSVPISQADPIDDFSSPSHAESSSAARRRAQGPRISNSTAGAGSQPTPPNVKLVPKIIDGEVWMTSPDSDDDEAAAVEVEGTAAEADWDHDLAGLASIGKNSSVPSAEYEALSRAKNAKITALEAAIAKLQDQLAAAIPPPDPAPPVIVDPKIFEERDNIIRQLRADVISAQAKAVARAAIDPVVAERDAKIAELESTIATLSSTLIEAEKRMSEPSVEVRELKEGNEFLIRQMDEATSRFELAERDLAAARAEIVRLATGAAPTDPVAIGSLQADVAASRAEQTFLARKVKNLSDENDFFRQQYQQASNSAVESVRQARELEEEVEKLRSQLKLGLKQRNMHYEAIHAKREAEALKLRATNAILLEQSRRTDDAIRRKAALYDKYRAENELLREHESAWQERYAALQERNEELADQVAALRGKQMGVFEDEEGVSDYTEGDAEDDITDDGRAGRGSVGYALRGNIGGFTSSQIGSQVSEASVDNPFRVQAALGSARGRQADDEQMAEGEVESLIDGDGEMLRCHWRIDQTQCDLAFDRLEDLAHHARAHAYDYEVKVEA